MLGVRKGGLATGWLSSGLDEAMAGRSVDIPVVGFRAGCPDSTWVRCLRRLDEGSLGPWKLNHPVGSEGMMRSSQHWERLGGKPG